MTTLTRCLLLTSLALSTACTHRYAFPERDFSLMQGSALDGRKVHLDLEGVPAEFTAKASGHTFQIQGVRNATRSMLTKMFGAEHVVERSAADVTVDIDLDFDMSGTMFGTSATCDAKCSLRGADDHVLGQGTAAETSSYPTIGNGGRNCEIAMMQSVAKALDGAMAALDETAAQRAEEPAESSGK